MRRRALTVVAALLLLAACSSSGSPKSSPTTTARSNEAQAYADAVLVGLIASTPDAARADVRSDLHCVAQAIVEGIGVARFRAGGVTIAQLHDPEFEPPESVAKAMSPTDREALAEKLQACGIGRIVGSRVSLDFARAKNPDAGVDQAAVECFGRGFEGAVTRPMIAGMMLNALSAADAGRLANLTVGCVGSGAIFENASGLKLSSAELACIDRAGMTEDALARALSANFRGVESTAVTPAQRFGAKAIACLTPAHLAQLPK